MKFKIGDRVRIYAGEMRLIGKVTDITNDYSLIEVYIGEDEIYFAHPKQCRKLKPKPITQKTEGMTFSEALCYMQSHIGRCVTCYQNEEIYFWIEQTQAYSSMPYLCLFVRTSSGRAYEWHPNQQELLEYKYRVVKG